MGGYGLGSLSQPQGIALDRNGSVYVVDRLNGRVDKFDKSGNPQASFKVTSNPDGTYGSYCCGLTGIAVDNQGFIYVSDSGGSAGRGAVWKLYPNGTVAQNWSVYGGQSAILGGMAVDGKGSAYLAVTSGAAEEIEKFATATGSVVAQWVANGSSPFHFPTGIATDVNGSVYVVGRTLDQETSPPSVVKLNPDTGTITQTWRPNATAFPQLTGIAVGTNGTIFLTDPSANFVSRLSPSTGTVSSFADLGRYSAPGWIASGANGTLYVTDENLDSVYVLSSGGSVIATFGHSVLAGNVIVAVDGSGSLYIGDGGSFNGAPTPLRITKYNANGALTARWNVSPPGDTSNAFYFQSLYVDSSGSIYTFVNPARLSPSVWLGKFDQSGKLLASASFNDWLTIATVDGQGKIYADVIGKLHIYSSNLSEVGSWAAPNTVRGIAYYNSSLYFLTGQYSYETAVQKFSLTGAALGSFAVKQEFGNQIDGLNSLAIDSDGNIYVSDLRSSVWKFDQSGVATGQFQPGCPRSIATGSSGIYVASSCPPNNVAVYFYSTTAISGVVTDSTHKGVPNVRVAATGTTSIVWSASTDNNGRYQIQLPAGSYTLAAVPQLNSQLSVQWYSNQSAPSSATVLTVPPSTTANFVLPHLPPPAANVTIPNSYGGAVPSVSVHNPFRINYTESPPDFYTSGTATIIYPDGTTSVFQMNLTQVHFSFPKATLTVVANPYYNGQRIQSVRILINLPCPPAADPLFKFLVYQSTETVFTEAASLAEIGGMTVAENGVLLPYGIYESANLLTEGLDEIGSATSQHPGYTNTLTQTFMNSQLGSQIDIKSVAPGLVGANGQFTSHEAEEALYTAYSTAVQYMETRGLINQHFIPALYNGASWRPADPKTDDPVLILNAVLAGNNWDPNANGGRGGLGQNWWDPTNPNHPPLTPADVQNIRNIIMGMNNYFKQDGSGELRSDCIPRQIELPLDLVDPSGAVTDAVTGVPVVGANVALFGLNQTTGKYQLVNNPSLFEPGSNPESTDARGSYGWDVVPGRYYVVVTAKGYHPLNSSVVLVPPPVTDLNLRLLPIAAPQSALSIVGGNPSINGWFKTQTVQFNLTAKDSAGLRSLDYAVDNNAMSLPANNSTAASSLVTVSGDGIHTFTYWSVGADGSTEQMKTVSVLIDTTPPLILGGNASVVVGQGPSVTIYDGLSGVQNTTARLDGAPYVLGTPINTLGSHILSIVATDLAGNSATRNIQFPVVASEAATTTSSNETGSSNLLEVGVAFLAVAVAAGVLVMKRRKALGIDVKT